MAPHPAENLNTTPLEQIECLRLLKQAAEPHLVREEEVDLCGNLQIRGDFSGRNFRSSIEATVSASGMGDGSQTLVQELLDSVPAVYGYCYLEQETGLPVRMELDTTEALNTVFNKNQWRQCKGFRVQAYHRREPYALQ